MLTKIALKVSKVRLNNVQNAFKKSLNVENTFKKGLHALILRLHKKKENR